MLTLTQRNLLLIATAIVLWALAGSLVYGLQWSAKQDGMWLEWILGGQLRWLPWVGFAVLVIHAVRRLESSGWSRFKIMCAYLALGIGIVLLHAVYLRVSRPVLPMLLNGRSYSVVFNRFTMADYLNYQGLFLDFAVYLVIAVPVIVSYRLSQRSGAVQRANDNGDPVQAPAVESLLVRKGDRSILLPVSDIELIEAADYYVQIYHGGEKTLHRDSIQNLEASLPSCMFARVHRRALVNMSMIVELVAQTESTRAVRMKSGMLVEVSRRRRREVERRLKG